MRDKIRIVILFLSSLIWRYFTQVDPNTIVFGARGGRGFEGYAKCLFLYAHGNTDFNCIWISKNKLIIDELNQQGYAAYYFYSFTALRISLSAKAIFITHSITDAMPIRFHKQTLLIDLWHGTPIKKFGFLDRNQSFLSRCIAKIKSKRVNYLICPADSLQVVYSEALHIPVKNVIVAGNLSTEYLQRVDSCSKVQIADRIIYCPTFRDYEYENLFLEEGYLKTLNTELCRTNKCLDIKLHPQEKLNFNIDNFTHIRILDQKLDIYTILHHYACLVTDYSSVIYDFATSFPNRKIAIVANDVESYRSSRGFVMNYDKLYNKVGYSDLLEFITSYDTHEHEDMDIQKIANTYDKVLNLLNG